MKGGPRTQAQLDTLLDAESRLLDGDVSALTHIEALCGETSGWARPWLARVRYFREAGKASEALNIACEGLEKCPTSAVLALNVAEMVAEQGERLKALALLSRMDLVFTPELASRVVGLVEQLGGAAEAVAFFERISGEIDVGDPPQALEPLHGRMVLTYARAGRLMEARRIFKTLAGWKGVAETIRKLNGAGLLETIIEPGEVADMMQSGPPNIALFRAYRHAVRPTAAPSELFWLEKTFADHCRRLGLSLLRPDAVELAEELPGGAEAAKAFWRRLCVPEESFEDRLEQARANYARLKGVQVASLPSSQPLKDFFGELDQVCRPPDFSVLEAALAEGRGAGAVTHHENFWLISAAHLDRRYGMARGVYGWPQYRRTSPGPDIFLRREPKAGLRELRNHLRRGGLLMQACDGVGAQPEPIIPTPIGLLPLATALPRALHAVGAPSVWINCYFHDGAYDFEVERLPDPEPGQSREDFILRWGQAFYEHGLNAARTTSVFGEPLYARHAVA